MRKKICAFSILLVAVMILNSPLIIKAVGGIQKYDEMDTTLHPAVDMVKDSDNNYYAVGSQRLVKMDVYRDIVYTKDLNEEDIPEIFDCESVDVDSENNVYLLCQMTKIFKDSHVTIDFDMNRYAHAALVKLDPEGEIVFVKDYSSTYDYDSANELRVFGDYIYFVTAKSALGSYLRTEGNEAYYNYTEKRYLTKTDLNGNKIWEKRIGTKEYTYETSWYTQFTSAGGASVTGKYVSINLVDDHLLITAPGVDGEMFFGKYDLNGNKVWERELGTLGNEIVDITLTYDGNYMAIGSIYSSDVAGIPYTGSGIRPVIIKVSPSGSILSYKIFNGRGSGTAIRSADGGYYAIVDMDDRNVEELNNENASPYLIKMDNQLNVLDTKELAFRAMGLFTLESEGVYAIDDWGMLSYYSNEEEKVIEEDLLIGKKMTTPLKKIFQDTSLDTEQPLLWVIEDEGVVTIDNKNIVPVNSGSTTITTTKGLNRYVLNVEVSDKDYVILSNPLTFNIVLIDVILFAVVGVTFLLYYFFKNRRSKKDSIEII